MNFLRPEILALLIPIVALTIPIVKVLTDHQRRMAEILNQPRSSVSDGQIEALRREVAELKDLVHRQTIALDTTNDLRQRVS